MSKVVPIIFIIVGGLLAFKGVKAVA